jgi:hypothetical protein
MDRVSLGGLVAKIISFGDSFLLGNELGLEDGTQTWPGIIAQRLGCEFDIRAMAGCGNEYISRQILDYFDPSQCYRDTLVVINWTWSMRWDFYIKSCDKWIGLGPTCVPDKIKSLVSDAEAQRLIDFYQAYLAPSDSWNKHRSLSAIYTAQQFLESLDIKNIQTYMDPKLWYPNFPKLEYYHAIKDPLWPQISAESDLDTLPDSIQKEVNEAYSKIEPGYINSLRSLTKSKLHSFDGLTFLEWAEHKGFEITPLLHPLQPAHNAAADFWEESYRKILSQ